MELEEWGEFDDDEGWNGYVPCVAYFVAVFLQLHEADSDFLHRCIQMVDGEVLAGDASLKVPKLIRLAGGAQYKKFLYTIMNGHGQIVGFWFVDQDSAEQLSPFLNAVNLRFEKHGREPPVLAYGDNCCGGDRTMFTSSFPSLQGGLEAKAQREQAQAREAKKLPKATLAKLGCEDEPVVIRSMQGAVEFAHDMLMDETVETIGLDAEWATGRGAGRHDVDVLQFAVPGKGVDNKTRVYILQLSVILSNSRVLPPPLLMLLQSDAKVFVGNRVQGDLTRMGNHFNVDLGRAQSNTRPTNIRDTSWSAYGIDPARWRKSEKLSELAAHFLKMEVPKEDTTRKSIWNKPILDEQQKLYAAIDVAVGLRLDEILIKKAARLQRCVEGGFVVGDRVSLLTSCRTVLVGLGSVTALHALYPHCLTVSLRKEDVLVLSATLPWMQDGKTLEMMFNEEDCDVVRVLWPRVDVRPRSLF